MRHGGFQTRKGSRAGGQRSPLDVTAGHKAVAPCMCYALLGRALGLPSTPERTASAG